MPDDFGAWPKDPNHAIHHPGLAELTRAVEDRVPGLLRLTYPRIYEGTGGYHSPKLVGVCFATMIAEMQRTGINAAPTAHKLMYPGLKPMIDRKFPLYFVAPQLVRAIRQTVFRDDIDWLTMKLPYEQGIFVLPRNAFHHSIDGEVAFLHYSRIMERDYPPPVPGLPILRTTNNSFCFTLLCTGSDMNELVWYDGNFTEEKRRYVRFGNMFHHDDGTPAPELPISDQWLDEHLQEGDSDFLESAGALLFGILLALTVRPELLEPAKPLRTIKARRPGERDREFWQPAIIGRRYVIKRDLGGTHASPRLHFRRGHFRQQPHGPHNSLRKQLWIEPTLISADTMTSASAAADAK